MIFKMQLQIMAFDFVHKLHFTCVYLLQFLRCLLNHFEFQGKNLWKHIRLYGNKI
jgi:hypothetical protein